MKFKRPVPDDIPVSARYGTRGSWWNWHINGNGQWVKGQVSGMGLHKGIDFAAPVGTPVFAVCDGVVERCGYEDPKDSSQGFGLRIWQLIRHNNEPMHVIYAHLKEITVLEGQEIKQGDRIAYSGNSGKSSGPHLHIELRDKEVQFHPIPFEEAKDELV